MTRQLAVCGKCSALPPPPYSLPYPAAAAGPNVIRASACPAGDAYWGVHTLDCDYGSAFYNVYFRFQLHFHDAPRLAQGAARGD